MYELTVERVFSAAHAITIHGEREPIHGHNWRVRLTVSGRELDANGLVCDFHVLERALDAVIGMFHNRNLNDVPPFDRVNPTAENVARHIAEAASPNIPTSARLESLSITEAPGCIATWRPPR